MSLLVVEYRGLMRTLCLVILQLLSVPRSVVEDLTHNVRTGSRDRHEEQHAGQSFLLKQKRGGEIYAVDPMNTEKYS